MNEIKKHDPYLAIRIKPFRTFLSARFLLTVAIQIQMVAVGWQVYQITHDAFSLGLMGLSEAVPAIAVALFGGQLADRFNKKRIIIMMVSVLMLCSFSLFLISKNADTVIFTYHALPIYMVIFFSGLARGILGPAVFAFWPQILPDKSVFTNAVTWNSIMWQVSATVGPAIGGLMIAPLGLTNTYLFDTVLVLISVGLFASIKVAKHVTPPVKEGYNFWQEITAGFHFVFSNQILLGAITLDLFAVLFGGAVALLPVFAQDILHVGAFEFGLLKSAMGVGSALIALVLIYKPIGKHAGKILLWSVAGFGACTIGFGLSEWLWLSLLMLFLCGIFDGISVVIRGTLMQVYTPDHMKGRVSAINNIFIGSSNEIGAFESGTAAKLMGVVPSVVFGGIMSLVVVGTTTWKADKLRKLDL